MRYLIYEIKKRNIVVARDAILPGILLIFPIPNNDTNKNENY